MVPTLDTKKVIKELEAIVEPWVDDSGSALAIKTVERLVSKTLKTNN